MKRLITLGMMFVAVAMMFGATAGTVTVTSVTAQQRYPWNGLVDVSVTIQGTAEDLLVTECTFAATNSATKAEIPILHITRNGVDTGSVGTWMRKFIWDAKTDVGAVKIDDVELSVDVKPMGVQLWENGPYWAECNVGATKPEECGYYFWWGDTVGYRHDGNRWNAVDMSRTGFLFDSWNCPTYGYDGYLVNGKLASMHDAATAHLGVPWRMPTESELSSLAVKCTTMWTMRKGVYGLLVTGNGTFASRSMFLPAAGVGCDGNLSGVGSSVRYWASTPTWYNTYLSFCLLFASDSLQVLDESRYAGLVVRPLRSFTR